MAFNAPFLMIVLAMAALVSFGNGKNPMRKWPSLSRLRSSASPEDQASSVRHMLGRLLPGYSTDNLVITVNVSLSEHGRDVFVLRNDPDGARIQIHGSTGVAAAWGFQYYAKTVCGCHFSWSGDQVATLPATLPRLRNTIKIVANDIFRYYQNVCTASYSFVWWNWTRWEREIDWMALNGVNLPLAFNGQEEIFRRVYLRLGLQQADLDPFFAGPAFQAWGRMGNMDGWGGPLPAAWYRLQLALQHRILDRMRAFGMIPVLPAFSGHVPPALETYYPNATVTRLADWGNFNSTYCCTYLLDHADPLFRLIGSGFLRELRAEFGTEHAYACDTFNEIRPPSDDPGFVADVGRAVFGAMEAADPDAVWLMQSWMFRDDFWDNVSLAEALLTSVPKGRMIVLDLQAEVRPQYQRLSSYFGQPFIWCMLHNFGGVKGLYGAVDAINAGPFDGRSFPNSTMVGTGIVPEGIEQNDVVYELMNEMALRRAPVDVDVWFTGFSRRRYGDEDPNASAAWKTLARTVYNCTDGREFHGRYVVTQRPSFKLDSYICYDRELFMPSWDGLVNASSGNLGRSDLFRHDLVDVTREALVLMASEIFADLKAAFQREDSSAFALSSARFLDLLDDLERVLASDRRFLLGVWLESAKTLATTPEESDLYEYNARNQITLWGPTGEIRDYATKQWSGVVADYYGPRWTLFFAEVQLSLDNGTAYRQDAFAEHVFTQVEAPFTLSKTLYPCQPRGDPILIVQQIHAKWRLGNETSHGFNL